MGKGTAARNGLRIGKATGYWASLDVESHLALDFSLKMGKDKALRGKQAGAHTSRMREKEGGSCGRPRLGPM